MSESTPMFCDNCQTVIRLEKKDDRTLKVRCACNEGVGAKVSNALPEEWL